MKVLLVGNIANNSYLIAKFLRRRGIEADLLIYDYKHIMGQPEWEDGVFEELVDEFNPDLSKVENFSLPDWVTRISLADISLTDEDKKTIIDRIFNLMMLSLYYVFARPLRLAKSNWYNARLADMWKIKSAVDNRMFAFKFKKRFMPLVKEFKTYFADRCPQLNLEDISTYYGYPSILSTLWKEYDLLHLADVNPMYGLIDGTKPYVAFEHGTLRDIPFEDSARGRLLSLAYKKARKVIITNCDCIRSAKSLNLDNYVFIPHPIDDEKFHPRASNLRKDFEEKYNANFIIFFPARQSYDIKGTDQALKAFGEFIRRYPKSLLIISQWGEDKDNAELLIRELGIESHVHKISPLTRLQLVEYYNMADVVFDQFTIGAFGTTTPEALSCGKPLFLYLDESVHRWAFSEMPPVINVSSDEEIFKALIKCRENAQYVKDLSIASRLWIKKYHGWKTVTDCLIKVYEEALK
ncbi:MAG: Alpha-monoglucosyldiacylglycerol synthase [Pelotomaculum sp. PtaU1.Bin065]|nr:MAG: Alpha-monoglucosyldiacylglycerol synthase [Pelotomaculum sp. PtaU1.Bin065]